MADYEVQDADIWVGATAPTAADPDDFWFDTSKVPLFGIKIEGTLGTVGPPPDAGSSGEAWWDSEGHLWVWDGTTWVDQGGFRGPEGPQGPTGGGLHILGTLPVPGPPPGTGTLPGDAWIDSVGGLWVWDGTQWSVVDLGGADGGGGDPALELRVTQLEAKVAQLEALMTPSLLAWIQTADWSPDGNPVPDPVFPVAQGR